jgi:hypothetical protein
MECINDAIIWGSHANIDWKPCFVSSAAYSSCEGVLGPIAS